MADVKNPKKNHHGHHHLHALLIPYPFQGHVNPFVHLAIKLASQGITVTFVNTHYIHHQITNGSDGDIFAGVRSESGLDIRYATVSDGLPVGFDRSLNHDTYQSSLLHVFYAHVEELVASLVGGDGGVNVMIADTFFVWPSVVARKFGLVCVSFWTEAALVFSLYYHMDLLRIHGHFGAQGNLLIILFFFFNFTYFNSFKYLIVSYFISNFHENIFFWVFVNVYNYFEMQDRFGEK